MSQIKATEFEGDMSVGRHITTGGNAAIRGNATVGKNLRVEGWLEAPNIKGPCKGLFETVEKLRGAYPLPENGCWALVGTSLPADVYIADGNAWVATGEKSGELTIDYQRCYEAIESIADSVGAANGIAPLGADGTVPKGYLPLSDVIEFDGIVYGVEIYRSDSAVKPSAGDVVFDNTRNIFLLRVSIVNSKGGTEYRYHDSWLREKLYGVRVEGGVTAETGKLYVDRKRNMVYSYDGTEMIATGMPLKDVKIYVSEKIQESASAERQLLTRRILREKSDVAPGHVIHRGVMPLYAKPYTYYVCKAGERPKFRLPRGYAGRFWKERSISFSVPRDLQGHICAADYSMPCGRNRTKIDFEIHHNSHISKPDQSKGAMTIITPYNGDFDIRPGVVLHSDFEEARFDRVMYYNGKRELRFAKLTVQDRYPEPEVPQDFLQRLTFSPGDTVTSRKRDSNRKDKLPRAGFIVYKKKQCGKEGDEGKNGIRFFGGDHSFKYWGKVSRINRGVYRVCYVTKKGYRSKCVAVTCGVDALKRFVVKKLPQ